MFCYKLNLKSGVPLKAGNMGTMLLVMKESGSVPAGLKSEEERYSAIRTVNTTLSSHRLPGYLRIEMLNICV